MEQYQYVEGFQRLHTGLRLRCAACLCLQFLLFEYSHYDMQHSFCISNEKSIITAPGPLTTNSSLSKRDSTLLRAFLFVVHLLFVGSFERLAKTLQFLKKVHGDYFRSYSCISISSHRRK